MQFEKAFGLNLAVFVGVTLFGKPIPTPANPLANRGNNQRQTYPHAKNSAKSCASKIGNAKSFALEETTMNISKIVMPLLLGALLLPVAANAQGINNRRENQRDRIQQGVRSGELTHREARRLNRREARISRTERRDSRYGGHLTPAQRANIQRRLSRTNRAIYSQKHNRQER